MTTMVKWAYAESWYAQNAKKKKKHIKVAETEEVDETCDILRRLSQSLMRKDFAQ